MWRIWVKYFDEKRKLTGIGYYYQFYERRKNAERVAKKRYGDHNRFEYVVAQTCPW